jgi:hypothetical protein
MLLLDRLDAASAALHIPLRMGDGLCQEAFDELCAVLEETARAWSEADLVPKRAAGLMADLAPAIEACSDLYDAEEAERVRVAADTIADLVRGCLAVRPTSGRPGRELFLFAPRSSVPALPAGALVHDVSSRAALPFSKLSPFHPHGGIPVPGMQGVVADSVEGVWQGLKVIDGRIDEEYFRGKGRKRRGKPEGHRLGDRLLGYLEARRDIYIPAYEHMWRMCIGNDLRELLFAPARRGEPQYFYDFEDNGDPGNPGRPLAHSSVLVRLLAEELDERYGRPSPG